MKFEEEKKHLKFLNSKMEYLHKDSFYWDHKYTAIHSGSYRFNPEKTMRKQNYYCKESLDHSNEYPPFFTSKTYSNVNSSILSYIVGGFVGSKSQINTNKKHNMSYDLSAVISNLLNPFAKCDQEKTVFTKNCDSFCGLSSKVQSPECYDKYIMESSDCANIEDKNSLIDMVDIECLIAINPFKDFVENQACVLDNLCDNLKNLNAWKCNVESNNSNDSKNHKINQLNVSANKAMEIGKDSIKNSLFDLVSDIQVPTKTDNVKVKSNVQNQMSTTSDSTGVPSTKDMNLEISECCRDLKTSCKLSSEFSSIVNNDNKNNQTRHSVNYLSTERFRKQSECSIESTDSESFIVFEEEPDKDNKLDRVLQLEDGYDSDDGDEEEDEDEEGNNNECDYMESDNSDEYDFCSINKNVLLANDKWLRNYNEVIIEEDCPKKVKFEDEVKVKRIIAWEHAYRTARLGPWEQFARDRVRFQERISRLSLIISPILSSEHRNKIYEKINS